MPQATSNTGNTGAFNGAVWQQLKGIRSFLKLMGAPKAHSNIEFPISTNYSVEKDPQYFTEATENEATTVSHTDYSNEKNTFSFMKKAIEVSQTALNASKHIADANVLAEVGANYFLTDVFSAQLNPKLQAFGMEINSELINSTYTPFTVTGNRTRGLLEAAESYAETNIDASGLEGVELVEKLEELLISLGREGVTFGAMPIGNQTDVIDGLATKGKISSRLTLLVNPSTRHFIEKTIRSSGNSMFQIERSRNEAGTAITLLITSFGDIEFVMDEDMPVGKAVLARFAEMRPVIQPNNPIGREGGEMAPVGGIISMVKDMKRSQGIGIEMFVRIGLDYGTPNRIGFIDNLGVEAPVVPAPEAKTAKSSTEDK